MQAFHNDPQIKEFYVNRILRHKKFHEIIKEVYWEDGKGCAVGCTIHGSNHAAYETELGIPSTLAFIEDRIFENLPNNLAKEWPLAFIESIKPGADLSKVWPKFAIFLLTDPSQCNARHPHCAFVADKFQQELNGGDTVNWIGTYNNVKSYPSDLPIPYDVLCEAIYNASCAAAYASAYKDDARYVAIASSHAAYSYWSAEGVVREKAWIAQSEKLLELLKECE